MYSSSSQSVSNNFFDRKNFLRLPSEAFPVTSEHPGSLQMNKPAYLLRATLATDKRLLVEVMYRYHWLQDTFIATSIHKLFVTITYIHFFLFFLLLLLVVVAISVQNLKRKFTPTKQPLNNASYKN